MVSTNGCSAKPAPCCCDDGSYHEAFEASAAVEAMRELRRAMDARPANCELLAAALERVFQVARLMRKEAQ